MRSITLAFDPGPGSAPGDVPLKAAPPPPPPAGPAAETLRRSGIRLRYDVDHIDNREPWVVERMAEIVERAVVPYHRAEVEGLDRVPEGAALYVGNHSGGAMTIDSFIFGAAVFRRHGMGGLPYILAHDFALGLPGLHVLFSALGCVRASRENARRLLEQGRKVLVYPGGATEALRPYRDRDKLRFGGHRGYVRTALTHGVPIVPVVGQGSHATFIVLDDARWMARLLRIDRRWRLRSWGIAFSLPWGLTPFPPPLYIPLPTRIRMEVLAPIRFSRQGEDAARDEDYVAECARLVEDRMQASLDRLARR